MEDLLINIDEIRKLPNGSIKDAETIRQIALWSIKNPNDNDLVYRIDPRFNVYGLYPEVIKSYNIKPDMSKEEILNELEISGDVIGMFPYGSQVYGTATGTSDRDYIIVMKSAMLEDGAFKHNAISNSDYTIQGVVYSRGGFIDAINNYEIGALECLSLPDSQKIVNKWPFKVTNWNEKEMVRKIIEKASASRHIANMQSKNGDKEWAKKGMYHSLRILYFGLQLKEHQKIVNFQECNKLYDEFSKIKEEDFDTRNYFPIFDELLIKLRA